ncbi:hypothetical protein OB2597_03494 [Pseudooceanicola batsensis HTCC2597]|uniref:Uncharacterized protein n=1 Tax=Pseudooceanicola batsensis (strain ATCC BAA-863 / DSM 15984 / KCTC 12145 / HTCC2597) TaxID=252305 RepID=A3U423_PSEBH|nr:hypothetical protein [Pseudooceanicola batsensis]EAQ01070.1 hypothetical protein OB2597_03494 [Pseudooceanicola batsensis HTCC2597]
MTHDTSALQTGITDVERHALTLAIRALQGAAVTVDPDGRIVARIGDSGPMVGSDWLSLWEARDRAAIVSALRSRSRGTITLSPTPQGQTAPVRIWVAPQERGEALVLSEGMARDRPQAEPGPEVRTKLHDINNQIFALQACARLLRRSVTNGGGDRVLQFLDEADSTVEKAHRTLTELRNIIERKTDEDT